MYVSWSLKIKGCKDGQDFPIYKAGCGSDFLLGSGMSWQNFAGSFADVPLSIIFAVRFERKGLIRQGLGFLGEAKVNLGPKKGESFF